MAKAAKVLVKKTRNGYQLVKRGKNIGTAFDTQASALKVANELNA